MSSTPGSRHRRHSSCKSQSSTPTQSTPMGSTSRAQPQNGNPAPSSSPLFYGSSPAKSTQQTASQRSQSSIAASSPLRQPAASNEREATPRATGRAPQGSHTLWNCRSFVDKRQSHPPSDMNPAQVRPESLNGIALTFPAAVVVFSYDLIDPVARQALEHALPHGEVTFTRTLLHRLRHIDEEYLSAKMGCSFEKEQRLALKRHSQISTLTPPRQMC